MGTYTCHVCGTEFEHHFKKKTCSEGCANAARSSATKEQWQEMGDEMASRVQESMNRAEVREHMRQTQLGDENSMAGRTGSDNPAYKPYAPFGLNPHGYEEWRSGAIDRVLVHRLLAVAEWGFDAVVGKHVHHKNHIRWDNRPENIEPLDPSEHIRKHRNDRQ